MPLYVNPRSSVIAYELVYRTSEFDALANTAGAIDATIKNLGTALDALYEISLHDQGITIEEITTLEPALAEILSSVVSPAQMLLKMQQYRRITYNLLNQQKTFIEQEQLLKAAVDLFGWLRGGRQESRAQLYEYLGVFQFPQVAVAAGAVTTAALAKAPSPERAVEILQNAVDEVVEDAAEQRRRSRYPNQYEYRYDKSKGVSRWVPKRGLPGHAYTSRISGREGKLATGEEAALRRAAERLRSASWLTPDERRRRIAALQNRIPGSPKELQKTNFLREIFDTEHKGRWLDLDWDPDDPFRPGDKDRWKRAGRGGGIVGTVAFGLLGLIGQQARGEPADDATVFEFARRIAQLQRDHPYISDLKYVGTAADPREHLASWYLQFGEYLQEMRRLIAGAIDERLVHWQVRNEVSPSLEGILVTFKRGERYLYERPYISDQTLIEMVDLAESQVGLNRYINLNKPAYKWYIFGSGAYAHWVVKHTEFEARLPYFFNWNMPFTSFFDRIGRWVEARMAADVPAQPGRN